MTHVSAGATDHGSDAPDGTSTDGADDRGPLTLVVPGKRPMENVLRLGLRWADESGRPLALLRPMIAPRQTPLDALDDEIEAQRNELEALQEETRSLAEDQGSEVPVQAHLQAGHRLTDTVTAATDDLPASEVLLPSLFPTGPDDVLSAAEIEALQAAVSCRSVAYREPRTSREVESILAAVGRGPHSFDVIQVADSLAKAHGTDLHVVHVVDPGAAGDVAGIGDVVPAWDRYPPSSLAEARVVEGSDVVDAILEETRNHDALAIGAPSRSRLRHFLYGSKSRTAGERAPGWTWTVRAAEA